jgi:hypothetical protein
MAVLTRHGTGAGNGPDNRTARRPTVLSLRRAALAALVVAFSLVSRPAVLESQTTSTDEVKAAFLFNFAKFVEWPSGASTDSGPLVLGVMGSDRIADALSQTVKDKTAGGRTLTARRVSDSDDLARLHVLFVGVSEKSRLADVMKRVDDSSVLTVSDVDGFCQLGGMIRLMLEKNRVRFEINLEAAEHSGLKVSSKLLTLARTVYPAKAVEGR